MALWPPKAGKLIKYHVSYSQCLVKMRILTERITVTKTTGTETEKEIAYK
jgi:hypothetical protein